MSVNIVNLGQKALELDVHGMIDDDDVERFVPRAEERIAERGQIGILLNLTDFEGYTASGFWKALRFDVKHYGDVARFALVARQPTKDWVASLSRPFTAADVKFFTADDIDLARSWVQTD